jgi:plastocyanin
MATRRYLPAGFLVVLLVVAAALAPTLDSTSSAADPVREIRLVARDMTYYLDGDTQPNPTLKLRAGERVKFVLRNEDEGMEHDFKIRAWEVGTGIVNGRGSDAVTFTVPALRGSHAYSCTPHPSSMRGLIEVE